MIDTKGYNDQTWLDDAGHPHTNQLRTPERFRRRDFGHMDLQLIIDDPTAYAKPWSAMMVLDFFPDEEMIENVCDNEKDLPHMVGK